MRQVDCAETLFFIGYMGLKGLNMVYNSHLQGHVAR